MRPRKTRIGLIAVELFLALNAFGGGYYGMSGAEGVPREWLERTPFDSYFVPSLILFALVGGSLLAAAIILWAKLPVARIASLAAGLVLLAWIVVETIALGYVSWMQPATFAAALLILALTWRLGRDASTLHVQGRVAA